MTSSDRGTFQRHPADIGVFLTTDGPDDGGRMVKGHKRYIYSEIGRFNSFPHFSLQYDLSTSADLARYGYVWCHDGSRLGYVKCVYCNHTMKDYQDTSSAAQSKKREMRSCPLLDLTCENQVANNKVKAYVGKRREVQSNYMARMLSRYIKHPLILSSDISAYHYVESGQRFTLKERAMSFPKPWNYVVPVSDLARYGFHWCGTEDRVKCNDCGLIVKNWQPNDLAAVVHTLCSLGCPFMNEMQV